MNERTYLFMFFTPQTFQTVILVIIPPVSILFISLTVVLLTIYVTRQEVNQTFITTCKAMIDLLKLLTNKRLNCVSFYKIFADLVATFAASS